MICVAYVLLQCTLYDSFHCHNYTALNTSAQEATLTSPCDMCQKKDQLISQLEDKLHAQLGKLLVVTVCFNSIPHSRSA